MEEVRGLGLAGLSRKLEFDPLEQQPPATDSKATLFSDRLGMIKLSHKILQSYKMAEAIYRISVEALPADSTLSCHCR